jgi:hypothetical protein
MSQVQNHLSKVLDGEQEGSLIKLAALRVISRLLVVHENRTEIMADKIARALLSAATEDISKQTKFRTVVNHVIIDGLNNAS